MKIYENLKISLNGTSPNGTKNTLLYLESKAEVKSRTEKFGNRFQKILERKIVRADFVSEKGHSCRAIFYRIFGPSESSSSRHCYFILKGMR